MRSFLDQGPDADPFAEKFHLLCRRSRHLEVVSGRLWENEVRKLFECTGKKRHQTIAWIDHKHYLFSLAPRNQVYRFTARFIP